MLGIGTGGSEMEPQIQGGLLFTGYLQEHIRDILPCQAKRAQSVIIRLHPGSNIDSEATMDPTSTSDLRKSNLCINLTRWTVRLESTSLNGLGDPQHPTSTTTLMPISHGSLARVWIALIRAGAESRGKERSMIQYSRILFVPLAWFACPNTIFLYESHLIFLPELGVNYISRFPRLQRLSFLTSYPPGNSEIIPTRSAPSIRNLLSLNLSPFRRRLSKDC
ncbi:hypothetical protein MJO28_006419 [Puccinia striiformis f. sp. tritici]|uniref:Uncharacterized protein n=1 Tax=Puccinia striiformis f. sp. tritici TaxID=168172 RepID=A0ACC0EJ40_9BASI|nr:hypothetical protein MJO28_006419 [Puccinia striiformis f. sp. tritici]